jgi:hypothetical protein
LYDLRQILEEREVWRGQIESLKRMRQWVLDAEHILDGSWAEQTDGKKIQDKDTPNALPDHLKTKKEKHTYKKKHYRKNECVTNDEVAVRFDKWRQQLAKNLEDGGLLQKERECLEHFLKVLDNLRPHMIQCYDRENFPRTNNETEGCIHKIKTRYRRISGRKNWNKYLLRHGRNVGFYDWWASTPERWQQFEKLARHMEKELWIQNREELEKAQSEQLTRYRFCHRREKFLTTLENQWDATASLAPSNQSPILH